MSNNFYFTPPVDEPNIVTDPDQSDNNQSLADQLKFLVAKNKEYYNKI